VIDLNTPAFPAAQAAATLVDLAARIEAEHEAVRAAAETGLEHAVKAGQLLIEAKTALPHGKWLVWVKANCTVSPRSVQAYVHAANEFSKLDGPNAQRVAHLSFRDALREMSRGAGAIRQATTPDVIEAALALAEQDKAAPGSLAIAVSRIQRQLWRQLPPQPPPPPQSSDQAAVQVMRTPERRGWCLRFGPNDAGIKLPDLLREARQDDCYIKSLEEIDELKNRAGEIEKEAEDLKRRAKALEKKSAKLLSDAHLRKVAADKTLAEKLENENGEIYAYVEVVAFQADEETDALLATSSDTAVIRVLTEAIGQRGGGLSEIHRGYYGDGFGFSKRRQTSWAPIPIGGCFCSGPEFSLGHVRAFSTLSLSANPLPANGHDHALAG
jgi:Protein of unknown function (DUF3102)